MSTEIIPAQDNAHLMPALTVHESIARRQAIVEFVAAVMVKDTDYGVIPGTGEKAKPTLLKPGAEKLCTLFGLSSDFAPVVTEVDATGEHHNGEPYIYYQYRCILSRNGRAIAAGIGSRNSWEKKYRYRDAQRICPNCGKPTIIKGKTEYGGGWLCFAKKGGCGAKFVDDDMSITRQQVGQVVNPDVFDVLNTIDKMAQKRALIAATLLAVNASEFFTQDVEDMADFAGSVVDVEARHVEKTPAQKVNKPQSAQDSHRPLTLDEVVEQAKAMLANPPAGGLVKSQFDVVKRTWSDVWGMAKERGISVDPIPGDKAERPSAYYTAIIAVGEAVMEYDIAVKNSIPA